MVLFILFIFICVISTLCIRQNPKIQYKIVFLYCFISFIFTGLRWNYGGDWDTYYNYFKNIKSLCFDDSSFEFGWIILSYTIKTIFNSYTLFQFFIASVIFFCIYTSIKKLSAVPLLSYFVYFAIDHGGINYVRTVIATCLIIYSLVYAKERKIIKYMLIWFCAFSIHFSSFIALPIYWIYNNTISFKKYIAVSFACISFFYISGKVFLSDFSLLGPYVQYKLDKYISAQESEEYFGSNITVEMAMMNYMIKKSFIFLFLFIYCKKALQNDYVFRGVTNVFIVGTAFYCSVVPIAMQFGRMSGYMDGSEIFIVPFIYKYIQSRIIKNIFLFLTILMNFIRINGHLDPDNPLIYNYHWVLF